VPSIDRRLRRKEGEKVAEEGEERGYAMVGQNQGNRGEKPNCDQEEKRKGSLERSRARGAVWGGWSWRLVVDGKGGKGESYLGQSRRRTGNASQIGYGIKLWNRLREGETQWGTHMCRRGKNEP